ncbi:hypothetical protein ACPF4W_001165 [Vibrio cholerae]|uniref:Uncharacterized protein n=1 Tax=Vibrio cholerae TaxID=666 RepID=A0A5C9T435_VIBCL|nr:hypothetical protein [Vibrio cholerae]EGQ9394783.1 hypothetical protein [Vibrio cholerae]EJL6331695.1 hypothetical protein [Vibrio cholerae]EJL6599707.1 hypothetical protein [Vibrio cholerae]EJO4030448.1 hypothetical protein [Vibrio cholerae]EKF9120055.1 hypothetical protein [Vibrio cholerae]
MKKILTMVFLCIVTFTSEARYTANFSGLITGVLIYPGSTLILISIEGMPKNHPKCKTLDYMAVDPDISSESRELVISRLLTAYATKERVNIGYDKESNSDSCVGERLRVHRVG